MNLRERIAKLLEPLGYKRTEEGFGSIRIEDTPGTLWALKMKEQNSVTKKWTESLAWSFHGPRSSAYVKYVDAKVYDQVVRTVLDMATVIEAQQEAIKWCIEAHQPAVGYSCLKLQQAEDLLERLLWDESKDTSKT